jgi:protein CpxP
VFPNQYIQSLWGRFMSFSSVKNMRFLAASAVLALGVGLGAAAHAQSAAAPADTSAPTKPMHKSHADRVEDQITKLHAELGITAAEETQWNAVAQVMRDNASEMDTLFKDHRATAKSETALDGMAFYQKETEMRAAEAQKLTAAFTLLYNAMSDDQKKNADAVFQNMKRHGGHKKKKS